MVVVGAIVFALLLGNVTAMYLTFDRSGALLRDTLAQQGLFCTSRKVPANKRLALFKAFTADFMVNGGMDTQAVLREFPNQLRGDVLMAIYAPLLETSTAFLRCPDPLRRHMLTLVRPVVALKKETVVSGGQYNSLLYILLKGSLQVTMAAGFVDGGDDRRTGNSPGGASTPSPAKFKRSATQVTGGPCRRLHPHLTSMTSTSITSTSIITSPPPPPRPISVVEGEDADADAREPRRRHPPRRRLRRPAPVAVQRLRHLAVLHLPGRLR